MNMRLQHQMGTRTLWLLGPITIALIFFTFGCQQTSEQDIDQRVRVAAGKASYTAYCAGCHGREGKGDGPITKMVKNQSMGDLSDKEAMSQFSDEDLYKVIAEGGEAIGKAKLMPAHKDKLGESGIQAIIAYIKTFQE